jgi:Fe2+ transport system protein FeoA
MTLYDAGEQTRVKLVEIHGGWGARQRLREVGLQVGDAVQVLRRAPFGGPLAIQNRETVIAIGRQLARKLRVEPLK